MGTNGLRTQFNEGKGHQGTRTVKTFEVIPKVMPKSVGITNEKKRKKMSDKSYIITGGI